MLAPYAEKSYQKYFSEYCEIFSKINTQKFDTESFYKLARDYADKKVYRDFEQGFQSWEMCFNSVGSSRGDYPFIAISFGIGTGKWETMASEVALKTRMGGQGKEGHKKPVLFPKLTFLYDENLYGKGKPQEWLFNIAIDCSSKCMYPKQIGA